MDRPTGAHCHASQLSGGQQRAAAAEGHYSKSGVFAATNAGYILTVENAGPQPCSLSNRVKILGARENFNVDRSQGPDWPRQRLDTTIVKQQPPQLTVLPGEDPTFATQDNDGYPGRAQG